MAEDRRRGRQWGVWSPYPGRVRATHGAWRWVPPVVALVLLLLIWWTSTSQELIAPILLPDPVAVLERAVAWTLEGILARYLLPTLGAAALGSLVAAVVAIPLGIGIAHSRLLAAVAEPFVAFSQTIPLVAIAPLLVLWIGYGTVPIAVLCAIIAFFPMVTTTVVGLRSLDARVIEHALLDGADGLARLLQVELPIAAPAILAGIRAGVVLSLTGAIVGEFVMGGSGLGTLLTISREATDTVGVFAVLVWIAIVALTMQGVVQIAERASARRLQGETT